MNAVEEKYQSTLFDTSIDNSNCTNNITSSPIVKSLSKIIDASINQVASMGDAVVNLEGIEGKDKIAALRLMCKRLSENIEALLDTPAPKFCGRLYKNRKEHKISGIDFVRNNYNDCLGHNLTLIHIKKFDPYLYTVLLEERKKNNGHWPKGFDLPDKEQIITRELSQFTPKQISSFERLGLYIRRNNL